jgi:alpha-ketoglutaric semialdehyde dehydrogenase
MLDETSFTPHGKHLIAGEWVAGDTTFQSDPATGPTHQFSLGSPEFIDRACTAAEEASWSFAASTREMRAALLHAIADEIDERGADITTIGMQ